MIQTLGFFFFSHHLLSNLPQGNLLADQRAFENWQVATSHRFPEGGGGVPLGPGISENGKME